MAAVAFVLIIAHAAELLGEDENWLQELSISMFPQGGCRWFHDVGERQVVAFTGYGIECLRQITADERANGRAPNAKGRPCLHTALTEGKCFR